MSNLTVDGDSNYTDTGTPDTYTAVSDGPTGSDVVAAHINGTAKAVTLLQALLGNSQDLKGSVANLVTRLSLMIAPDGAFRKGTSFPGSPIDGQPFYRTDQDIFYVYDATSTTWKSGFDNLSLALLDGTRDFTGDIKIKKAVPSLRLKGVEGSGEDYKIGENAGTLTTWKNTGSEGTPAWTEDNFFCPTGSMMAYAGSIIPNGWLECVGTVKLRTAEPRLFNVIGTTYNTGGELGTEFRLPDKRGRTSIGAGTGSGLTARTQGAKLGSEGAVGAHTHGITDPTHAHNLSLPDGTGSAAANSTRLQGDAGDGGAGTFTGGSNAAATGISTVSAGAADAIQPSEVDKWIIKT